MRCNAPLPLFRLLSFCSPALPRPRSGTLMPDVRPESDKPLAQAEFFSRKGGGNGIF
jgi:hypothetical protein